MLVRQDIPNNIRNSISYDPTTGQFVRTRSRFARFLGPIKPHLKKCGYEVISVCGKQILAHRLAWFLSFGAVPDYLDHINGDRTDNRLANLREATASQNAFNQAGRSGKLPKGITWHRKCAKFQAQIQAYGRPQYLGLFVNLADAVSAYQAAASNLHGEFANFAERGGVE